MKKTIKMDAAGRVVVPHAIREKYGLAGGGHRLEIFESAEGIVLRPKPEVIPARRDPSGWVVFDSGGEERVDPARAVAESRERRHRRVRGEE